MLILCSLSQAIFIMFLVCLFTLEDKNKMMQATLICSFKFECVRVEIRSLLWTSIVKVHCNRNDWKSQKTFSVSVFFTFSSMKLIKRNIIYRKWPIALSTHLYYWVKTESHCLSNVFCPTTHHNLPSHCLNSDL